MHARRMTARLAVAFLAVAFVTLMLVPAAFAQDTTVYGDGDEAPGTEQVGSGVGGSVETTQQTGTAGTSLETEVLGTRLLAETGSDALQIGLIGLGAVTLGALALRVSRRRGDQIPVS